MPNWVSNIMNVTGKSEDVKTFIGDMSMPIPAHVYPEGGYISKDGEWTTEEVVFSFWNVIAPTDLKSYFTGDTWYNWNCENWGVKWDAKVEEQSTDSLDFCEYGDGQGSVSYHFDTAWGTPEAFLHAVVAKYPHLEFSVEFEEEQGWGGEYSGMNGELSLISEYDIPNSHADYADRDREHSCACAWGDLEDMYTDCPARIEHESDPNRLILVPDLTSLVG
jgi:hypothetical protein